MKDKVEPGATVCLRSGGPLMTVVMLRDRGSWGTVKGADCSWFERGLDIRSGWFPLAALELRAPCQS